MKTLRRSIVTTILLLLCTASAIVRTASAGTISGSVSVSYGGPGGCQAVQSGSADFGANSVGVLVSLWADISSCPSVGLGPFPAVSASLGALSGSLGSTVSGNCDQMLAPGVSVA